MTVNAADRKEVRRAEKAARVLDLQEAQVITQLCETAAGRRWVWNRLSEASVFTSSFALDAIQMAFNEGQRNQGLRLLDSIILHCPDNFTLMMREANDRSNIHDRAADNYGAGAGQRTGGTDDGRDPAESDDRTAGLDD